MAIDVFSDLDRLVTDFSDSNLKRANREVTTTALDHMQQYVPMEFGPLRSSGHVVGDDEIVWDVGLYAEVQYYTQFKNYTTPGTGPYWDLRASGNHMSEWETTYLRGLGL